MDRSDSVPSLMTAADKKQGIGKAGIDCVSLDRELRTIRGTQVPNAFATRFYKRAKPRTERMSTNNRYLDYDYRTTTPAAGETLQSGEATETRWGSADCSAGAVSRSFFKFFIKQLHKGNVEITNIFWGVSGQTRPPTDFLKIKVLLPLISQLLSGR